MEINVIHQAYKIQLHTINTYKINCDNCGRLKIIQAKEKQFNLTTSTVYGTRESLDK